MNRIGENLICTGTNQEVVEALVQNGVEFVVVDGLAVSWHCANRVADDMDLLVNPTRSNSERLSGALNALHLNGFTNDSFARPGIQAPLKQLHYADLLTPRVDGPTYSEVAADAVDAKLFNIPVRQVRQRGGLWQVWSVRSYPRRWTAPVTLLLASEIFGLCPWQFLQS